MDCSMLGSSALHCLPEFAQIHVHWASDVSSTLSSFIFCLQSFPASGCFPMSRIFASGGQSIRASASASVLPMNIQGWFPLGLTGLISLQSKALSRVFSSTNSLVLKNLKTSILWHSAFFYDPTLTFIHNYWKNHSFDYIGPSSAKWYLCFFDTLSRFVIGFLPRSKCILISWLKSPSALILEPKEIKHVTASTFLLTFAMKCWMVMDKEARHAAVHGVAKSWTWLSNWLELSWWNWILWS